MQRRILMLTGGQGSLRDMGFSEVAAKIEKKTARPPVDAFHLDPEQLTNPLLRHFESKKQ